MLGPAALSEAVVAPFDNFMQAFAPFHQTPVVCMGSQMPILCLVVKGIGSMMDSLARCSKLRHVACARQLAAERALRPQVDPFVEMSVRDGRALHTKTIWNNKDPVFNEVLSFVVDDPEHQSITAMVKDDDMQAFAKVLSAAARQRLAPQ